MGANGGTIFSGRAEIAETGTPVRLGTPLDFNWLIIQGVWGNGEVVSVGNSTVTYNGSVTDGVRLDPGQFAPHAGSCDRGDVYINGKKGDAANYWAGYVDLWQL